MRYSLFSDESNRPYWAVCLGEGSNLPTDEPSKAKQTAEQPKQCAVERSIAMMNRTQIKRVEALTQAVRTAFEATNTPKECVDRLIVELGKADAVEAVATVINRISTADGRIYDSVREWSAKTFAPSHDDMREARIAGVDGWLHSCKANSIAQAMIVYLKEAESKKAEQKTDTGAEHLAQILKERPDTMRALHASFGFDFCKPYAVASVHGRFTVKSLTKAIEAVGGSTSDGWRAVALVRDPKAVCWGRNDLTAVELWEHFPQGFDNEFERVNGFEDRRSFTNYYRKGDFHEVRKSDTAEAVVIAQRTAYVTKCARYDWRHRELIETGRRYRLIEARPCCSYDGTQKGIQEVTLLPLEGNGRAQARISTDYKKHRTTADIIDKSGYLLEEVREDLKRRAQARKAERQKALYLVTDDTAKVEELRKMLEIERKRLAHLVECARTVEMLEKVSDKHLRWWGGGYMEALRAFEAFERKTTAREYKSIEEAQEAYRKVGHLIFTMWEA